MQHLYFKLSVNYESHYSTVLKLKIGLITIDCLIDVIVVRKVQFVMSPYCLVVQETKHFYLGSILSNYNRWLVFTIYTYSVKYCVPNSSYTSKEMMSKFTQMYNFIVSIARSKTLLSWVSFYFIIAFDCFLLYLNIMENLMRTPLLPLILTPLVTNS